MPANRQTVTATIFLSQSVLSRLSHDSNLKVMLYSTCDPGVGPYAKSEISFPQQIEVKVNDQEVKANFKGLKNKPGSTRPADITLYMQMLLGVGNRLSITYAITTKVRFYLIC
jgi:E3 SUMO-protein ligase PIAS1